MPLDSISRFQRRDIHTEALTRPTSAIVSNRHVQRVATGRQASSAAMNRRLGKQFVVAYVGLATLQLEPAKQ